MNSSWGSYGKSMSEQSAENDSWYDCRGMSGWTNPLCWGPIGAAKRAQEAATDLYMSRQNGNGESSAPVPGHPGSAPGLPSSAPGLPDWDPYRRKGLPPWVIPVVGILVVGGVVSVVLGTQGKRKGKRRKS